MRKVYEALPFERKALAKTLGAGPIEAVSEPGIFSETL